MTFSADLLPGWLNLALGSFMLALLAVAVRLADWRALLAVPSRLHLIFGALGFCLGLWMLGVDVAGVLRVHLLGMTAVTLMLGWCFALQCGSAALVLLLWVTGDGIGALPAAWLCTVAVPASVSRLLVSRLARIERQNLFMYTLGGGFGGGMVAALCAILAALPILWLAGQESLLARGLENWPAVSLLLFPEGFINGMLLTAACVFYPQAVKTFDEKVYIDKP